MDIELLMEISDFLTYESDKQSKEYGRLIKEMLDNESKRQIEETKEYLTRNHYYPVTNETNGNLTYFRNYHAYEKHKDSSAGLSLEEASKDAEYWNDLEAESPEVQEAWLILKGWKHNGYDKKLKHIRNNYEPMRYWEAMDNEIEYQKILINPDKPMELL